MSITRIFKVEIVESLRQGFEDKFATLSKGLVDSATGFTSCVLLKPSKWSPNEYVMIKTRDSEADMIAFPGAS